MIAVIAVVVLVVAIIVFFASGFNPNAPRVNLIISNGNGYTHTMNATLTYHYECTILNSGTVTARNVRFEVKFYDINQTMIGKETASVGDIPAGTSKHVSIDVPFPTQQFNSIKIEPLYDI